MCGVLMARMILEILYLATAISVASQQESFEQQDERERQYEYESRYYSKPEDTRSAVGKFTFVKVKGEILNDDNPLLPPITTKPSIPHDNGLPFPLPFPTFDLSNPFVPSILQNLLTRPLNPDTSIFNRPHEFFESSTNKDGRLITISKIFSGLTFLKPDFGSGSGKAPSVDQVGHQDDPWVRFPTPLDHGTPNMDMPHDMHPPEDGPSRFFFHMPLFTGNDHGFPPHRFQDAEPNFMMHEKINPFLHQDNPPVYFPWPGFRLGDKKGKNGPKLIMQSYSGPGHEMDHFDCHCRPFAHDWGRLKRCFQSCSLKKAHKRMQ